MKKKTKVKSLKSQISKVGIFGGTFNPIHNGHIKMAEEVRKKFKLSVVYFIPSGNPPHKKSTDLLPARLRYELVEESIRSKKYFKVLDVEIKKRKPSYTLDTIKALKKKKTLTQESEIYFILGQDQFEKLKSWYKPEKLVELVTFLVLPRGIHGARVRNKEIKIPKIKNLKYEIFKTKMINISSKEILKKIKEGKSVSKLVPYKVMLMETAW